MRTCGPSSDVSPRRHDDTIDGAARSLSSHAKRIELHDALAGVTVWIYSQIGQPVAQRRQVFLLTDLAPGAVLRDIERDARAIVDEELGSLPAFCRALMSGERQVP